MKKHEGFRHLKAKDRDRIHALYGHGHNQSDIARVLGVHKGTISRELGRYNRTTWRYSAIRAQEDAEKKRGQSKRPGMKIAQNPELKREIIYELKKLRSPDEIAGRMEKEKRAIRASKNAIYKWLYSNDGRLYCKYLCTRRRKRRGQSRLKKRILIPNRIPLRERPEAPHLVHAEGDLFVSPIRTGSKNCGLLVVANRTKLLVGRVLESKKHAVIIPAMQDISKKLAPDTYTFDNGIENVPHAQFGAPAYFCDKGAPWQKPHVEGSIGLIRRWFLPKGTDLSKIPNELFQSQLHLLNSKYRKSLGYRSAYEVAIEAGIIDRIPRVSLLKAVAFR